MFGKKHDICEGCMWNKSFGFNCAPEIGMCQIFDKETKQNNVITDICNFKNMPLIQLMKELR